MQRICAAILSFAAAAGMNTTPDLVIRAIDRPMMPDFGARPVHVSSVPQQITRRNPGSAKHRAWKRARRNNIRKA